MEGEDTGAAVKMIKYMCEYKTSWMVKESLSKPHIHKESQHANVVTVNK